MSKKIESKKVNLNIDEMKKRLSHLIENNRFLQAKGKIPLAAARCRCNALPPHRSAPCRPRQGFPTGVLCQKSGDGQALPRPNATSADP